MADNKATFISAIAGVSFERHNVDRVVIGDLVTAERDFGNEYDKHAVKVVNAEGGRLGFLPKKVAAKIVAAYGDQVKFSGTVIDVFNGHENTGLRVRFELVQNNKKAKQIKVTTLSGRVLGFLIGESDKFVEIRTDMGTLKLPKNMITVLNPEKKSLA